MKSSRIGANALTMGHKNRALIMYLIFLLGPISRRQLARESGLTGGALTKITSELIAEGFVSEVGVERQKDAGPGRTPILLDLVPKKNGVIGVNISRQFIQAALVDIRGEILKSHYLQIPDDIYKNSHKVAGMVEALVSALEETAKLMGFIVYRVGISCPGIIDSTKQHIHLSSTMGWEDVRFGHFLKQSIGHLPLSLENNVKSMALAEQWFGAGAGFNNTVLIYIGYGVGCGQIIDGRIYAGSHFRAGELGHTTVNPNGQQCYCGKRGCLETVASGRAILAQVAEVIDGGDHHSAGSWDEERVTDMVAQGQIEVVEILEKAGAALGWASVNLVNILDPEVIVLAGQFAYDESPLFHSFVETVSEGAFHGTTMGRLASSKLGGKLGLLGAATIALKQAFYDTVS